jgi:hypothetical protein
MNSTDNPLRAAHAKAAQAALQVGGVSYSSASLTIYSGSKRKREEAEERDEDSNVSLSTWPA